MASQTSMEEREQIVRWTAAGEATWRITRRMGWRPETIRKWRRRYRLQGRAGLLSVMGRPLTGEMSTFPLALRQQIVQMRRSHPGWGAKTLHAELVRDRRLADTKLPSAAAIGRLLKAEGLTKRPERHSQLSQSEGQPSGAAHELWEMDARGYSQVPEVGVVTLINLNDRYSHLRLLSYPCRLGDKRASRHATTADYQAALRMAFFTWGLPKSIQVDHESVFHDNKSRSPFPTLLHQWLLALGVDLTFGRVNQPKDQAITERSHQLWAAQVLQGQRFDDWTALYRALEERRDFLNHDLPCRSLANRPPLVAYPQAHHSGRPFYLEGEADLLDLQRVYTYLAQGTWFRLVAANGILSLGGFFYYVGSAWHRQQMRITFNAYTRCFSFVDECGQLIHQAPIQGLSIQSLMGEWHAFATLPSFQLAFPFTWADLRPLRLFEFAT